MKMLWNVFSLYFQWINKTLRSLASKHFFSVDQLVCFPCCKNFSPLFDWICDNNMAPVFPQKRGPNRKEVWQSSKLQRRPRMAQRPWLEGWRKSRTQITREKTCVSQILGDFSKVSWFIESLFFFAPKLNMQLRVLIISMGLSVRNIEEKKPPQHT